MFQPQPPKFPIADAVLRLGQRQVCRKIRAALNGDIRREPSWALAAQADLVHPRFMGTEKTPLLSVALQSTSQAKYGERQQVAAVCFRILSTGVEFLLVRTRRGRWTFPKGGTQPGLTHAQSAALEAFEEAGVHGRIEEVPFLRYELRKLARENSEKLTSVYAHLCEVLQVGTPQEFGREPTWFSSRKAKRRLAEGRPLENARELGRVLDRAVARIRRLPARAMLANDPLFTVKFESSEIDPRRVSQQAEAISASHAEDGDFRKSPRDGRFRGKVLQINSGESRRPAT